MATPSPSMEARPTSAESSIVSSPVFVPEKFSIPISYKLTNGNFLLWKQQALATIKCHRLQSHLCKDLILKMYLTNEDALSSDQNLDFCDWEQQDNILLAWLLASLTENICVRMVGSVFAYQICEKIVKFYASQTRNKVCQLKTQLKSVKKTSSTNVYLLEIKKLVNKLIVVGAPIGIEEHIKAILDGLPSYYSPLVTFIILRLVPYSIEEMEALLLAVETQIEYCHHQEFSTQGFPSQVQANIAQG